MRTGFWSLKKPTDLTAVLERVPRVKVTAAEVRVTGNIEPV